MGKLEKVGAAVVGVLLCIIVAVGVLQNNDRPKDDGLTDAEREYLETSRRESGSASLERNVSTSGSGEKAEQDGPVTLEELEKIAARRAAEEKAEEERLEAEAAAEAARRNATAGSGNALGKRETGERTAAVREPIGEWPKSYTVRKNDYLGAICKKFYGTTRMTKAVLAHNPGLNPRRLIPGKTVIALPAPDPALVAGRGAAEAKPAAALRRPSFISGDYLRRHGAGGASGSPEVVEEGYYVVKKNDLLSTIAQKQLGSSKHWRAIYELNKHLIRDPNRLREGWKLKLPNVN